MSFSITGQHFDNNGFEIQTMDSEGLTIESVRSPRAPSGAEFLPARVTLDGKQVWSFVKDHKSQDFKGLALLRVADEELVIALVEKRQLCAVLPVRDLPHLQRVGGELVGGRKLSALIELKALIAEAEGFEPIWSKREEVLRQAIGKDEAVSRQAAAELARQAAAERQRQEEAKRAERRAERDAKRAEIIGRQRVFAQTLAGDRRHGHPVVGDEWMVLSDGTFCISVTAYGQNGEIGDLIESFVVKTNGSKKDRRSIAAVTKLAPQLATTTATKGHPNGKQTSEPEVNFVTVRIKDEHEEVILVANMDGVRALRDRGLNSGTLVMCPKTGDNTRFAVFSLKAGKIEPVTDVMRK